MKEQYNTPMMDVIYFESEDIITTSGIIITPGPGVDDTEEEFPEWE